MINGSLSRQATATGLGGESEQRLHHRQGHQLGVAELQCDAHGRPQRGKLRLILQQIVGLDVKCGREGVQVCLHTPTLDSLLACAQASPETGHLRGDAPEDPIHGPPVEERAAQPILGSSCGRRTPGGHA